MGSRIFSLQGKAIIEGRVSRAWLFALMWFCLWRVRHAFGRPGVAPSSVFCRQSSSMLSARPVLLALPWNIPGSSTGPRKEF